MFDLIGPKVNRPDWIISAKLRPDLMFMGKNESHQVASYAFPMLKAEHIPKQWLERDPGFPILLTQEADLDREWIYHPEDQTKKYYQLRQTRKKHIQKCLVILEETDSSNIEDYQHLGNEVVMIYRDQAPSDDYHQYLWHNFYFCFQSSWCPDLIVFNDKGYCKSFPPAVMHAIHLGGYLESKLREDSPDQTKALWYGQWELYD